MDSFEEEISKGADRSLLERTKRKISDFEEKEIITFFIAAMVAARLGSNKVFKFFATMSTAAVIVARDKKINPAKLGEAMRIAENVTNIIGSFKEVDLSAVDITKIQIGDISEELAEALKDAIKEPAPECTNCGACKREVN